MINIKITDEDGNILATTEEKISIGDLIDTEDMLDSVYALMGDILKDNPDCMTLKIEISNIRIENECCICHERDSDVEHGYGGYAHRECMEDSEYDENCKSRKGDEDYHAKKENP